jgi:hypothetical protein
MKSYFLILLLICTLLSACDLTSTSNYTPQITFVTKPLTNKNDTLSAKYTDVADVYMLDSISVGDTVTFHVLLNGFSNNLTSYTINRSDTTSTRLLLPGKNSLDSVFNSTASNYSKGKFIFKTSVLNLYFPFKYIALKESDNAQISFTLFSDANFDGGTFIGTNSTSFVLKTPIKKAKNQSLN